MDSEEVDQLVLAAAGGDQDAYERLVHRFASLVWAICRSFRLTVAESEDVSQVVWLRVVEHLGRIREPERFGAWIATTTRRECLAVVRHRRRSEPSGIDHTTPLGLAMAHLDPDVAATLDTRSDLEALREGLAALGDPCASLLRLLFIEPRPSYEEIAAALEMPVGSIGPTRGRCLDKLRGRPELARISGRGSRSGTSRNMP